MRRRTRKSSAIGCYTNNDGRPADPKQNTVLHTKLKKRNGSRSGSAEYSTLPDDINRISKRRVRFRIATNGYYRDDSVC